MDTVDPGASPLITTSMSEVPSAPEATIRADASISHKRAALIVSCRARSRALATSDCENSDRSAETGADGWMTGGGTASSAADATSTCSGAFGPGAELQRYATVPAAAAVATTMRPVAPKILLELGAGGSGTPSGTRAR